MGRCFFLVWGACAWPRPIARSRGVARACASVPRDPALYPEEARGQRHQQQLHGGLTGKRRGVRAHKRRRVAAFSFLHVCLCTATQINCFARMWWLSWRRKNAESLVMALKLALIWSNWLCQGKLVLWGLAWSARHSRLATLCTSENVEDSWLMFKPHRFFPKFGLIFST